MHIRKIVLVLCLIGLSINTHAQGRSGKILFTITQSQSIGRALIKSEKFFNVLPKTIFVTPTANMTIKHTLEQAILPGYFSDFSSQLTQEFNISDPGWLQMFVAPLDETKTFEGKFISDFKQVAELLEKPVFQGVAVQEALVDAVLQASEGDGKGFLVLAERSSHSTAPRDVFVLDLNAKTWISLKASKGQALANNHNLLRPDVQQATPAQQAILDTRGVLIKVDNEKNPTLLNVSTDGVKWETYSMETSIAQNLWAGWQEPDIYMSYNQHTGRVMYATRAGQPQFSSLQVLKDIRPHLEEK